MKVDNLFEQLGYRKLENYSAIDKDIVYLHETPTINSSILIKVYKNNIGIIKCAYYGDWYNRVYNEVPFTPVEIKTVYLKLKEEGYCD